MREVVYEKPQMTRVSLRNQHAVANCWSDEAGSNGKTWYYDSEGKGYIEFTLTGNCSGNQDSLNIVAYHNYEDETLKANAKKYLEDNLKNTIKQSFTGMAEITDDVTQIS